MKSSKNKRTNRNTLLVYLILVLGSLLMLFPFLWTITTSLKSITESMRIPPTLLPEAMRFANYTEAMIRVDFGTLYYNTAVMVGARTLAAIMFSTMAAYAFARIDFPLKNFFFAMVLIQMMVPGQIFLIPQFLLMARLDWLDTVKALVAPGIVSAFGTFLMRQFFLSLPKDLEEAARIDGCNQWQTYWHVMMPLARSGMVALGIFTALFAWKDLMWPLIVNTSADKMTLSTGLANLKGTFTTNYPVLMAGSLIAMWPMILLFILFQRQFIEGIASTGSKN
ncbi:carbohydrate ABC transporter permease [Anaerotalea alkaliphila]|uniref:Carbohydrate ABC transporter permease n=1 Tax=Anaerotalea alkaliphila TaxID=2662126 RepID=A0A7X5KLW4_9FIRM|nr:carbohydrate ABC transporter permease [Anaerotalea alkaliphila]NDL66344.1 carbohydrate ABC transporter permease [Anaerotalea alkaliphila]